MKRNLIAITIALSMVLGLAGCGSTDMAMSPSVYTPVETTAPEPYVPGVPVETSVQPIETFVQPDETPVQPVETPAQPDETPVQPAETPAQPDETPVQPDDADALETEVEIDNRTEDEKLADQILELCSIQATVETYASACVVDVRTAVNPYDVEWDYGDEYTILTCMNLENWDDIFDIEYYKATFPILAMQYHENTSFLYTHFATVGIHEGRQGSANFNVKAFMESCPDWIREKFNDNYACYYLYYVNSNEVDRNADYSGDNYPTQMTVIMTMVQAREFEEINAERERLGVEPLIFDSELAAFANYRCWINAAENYAAHDWAKQHNDVLWDVVATLNGNNIGENTISRFNRYFTGWYRSYARSEAHYNAMTSTKNGVVGNSNVYACDNTLEQYSNYKSETRWVHFDVFMDTVDTPLNHK